MGPFSGFFREVTGENRPTNKQRRHGEHACVKIRIRDDEEENTMRLLQKF